jgi:uncharacterized protein
MSLPDDVRIKKERAVSSLRTYSRALVALSGGVDSATLLAIAREALGADRILAVTGRSESVSDAELQDAAGIARRLGVRHEIVDTFEMLRQDYRANAGDRCFHCRSELFDVLSQVAGREGCDVIAYGAILDDLGDHRPGMKAASMAGVVAPLLEAQICKTDVRVLAKLYGLHVDAKPASACLASRIPVGTPVTSERLMQVGRAESELRRFGFRQIRVRHHGDIARIELGEGEADRLADAGLRANVVAALRTVGFRFVVLDLDGYREGSLNPGPPAALYSIGPSRDGGQ